MVYISYSLCLKGLYAFINIIRTPLGTQNLEGIPLFSLGRKPTRAAHHGPNRLLIWEPIGRGGQTTSATFPRGEPSSPRGSWRRNSLRVAHPGAPPPRPHPHPCLCSPAAAAAVLPRAADDRIAPPPPVPLATCERRLCGSPVLAPPRRGVARAARRRLPVVSPSPRRLDLRWRSAP